MLSQAFCFARYERKAGRIILVSTHLTWRSLDSNEDSIWLQFDQVKLQRISPDTKAKIQLQIVLEDSLTYTFHFNNDAGRNAQLRDRDLVKNSIHYFLLEKNKLKQSEDALKTRILSEDEDMLSAYKKLVSSKIITPDMFWKEIAKEKFEDMKQQLTSGISSSIISEVTQEADSNAHSRFNLNDAIIENIFATFPIVKVKYNEMVPQKMDEKEFWKLFFQSNFYAKTKPFDKDNILDAVLEDEIQTMKNNIDISAENYAELKNNATNIDSQNDAHQSDSESNYKAPKATKSAKLVDYINYSSSQILESMISQSNISAIGDSTSQNQRPMPQNIQDLEQIPLKIRKVEKFINGPVNGSQTNRFDNPDSNQKENFDQIDQFRINDDEKFKFNLFSNDNEDLKNSDNHLIVDEKSELWKELKAIYSALCELLTKYWKLKQQGQLSQQNNAIFSSLKKSIIQFSAQFITDFDLKYKSEMYTQSMKEMINSVLA